MLCIGGMPVLAASRTCIVIHSLALQLGHLRVSNHQPWSIGGNEVLILSCDRKCQRQAAILFFIYTSRFCVHDCSITGGTKLNTAGKCIWLVKPQSDSRCIELHVHYIVKKRLGERSHLANFKHDDPLTWHVLIDFSVRHGTQA